MENHFIATKQAFEVHNFAELKAALAGEESVLKLADDFTAKGEKTALEIKDNICESVYVTKMYTNGELFGEDGRIKADDTDFGIRENLEVFFADLVANNSFTNKQGTLSEGENIFVASRLDLIYTGVSVKDASVYFDVVDGKLVAGPAK